MIESPGLDCVSRTRTPRSTQEWVFHGASHNQDIQLPALQMFLLWEMDFAVTFCFSSDEFEHAAAYLKDPWSLDVRCDS